MRTSRLLGVATAVTILVGGTAAPAMAAPPSNDLAANATPVSLGFSETIDTTEATTDADDAQLNESCGAPATDASVWYLFEPTTDGAVIIDVSASNYSAGVAVGVGSPGNLTTVACGSGAILLDAVAGETYYVLAFDDQTDGGGNGGLLSISFVDPGPMPTVELTLNRFGRLDGRGNAIIRGTYTCENADFIQVFGDVLQIRRTAVRGSFDFFDEGTCDGTRRMWEEVARSFQGDFVTDRALVTSFGFACGEFLCADGYIERVVRLRPARG